MIINIIITIIVIIIIFRVARDWGKEIRTVNYELLKSS